MNNLFGKLVGAVSRDLTPGYTLKTPLSAHDPFPVFALHHASSRSNALPALAFVFDASSPAPPAPYGAPPRASLAKAALSQIKRLKHPDILCYVAGAEHADGSVFFATEAATPLATLLQERGGKPLGAEAVQWGLFTVSRALAFMHQSGLIHGRLNAASIFVTPAGDWKLGGLEVVTQHAAAASLGRAKALQAPAYQSPEFANGNWSAVAAAAPGAVDSWALGCLIFHAHKGQLGGAAELRDTGCIPKGLLTAYQKLLASNPSGRAPAGQVPNHPYFKGSKYIELNMFVENWALKGEMEREAFLMKLPSLMDSLPDGFCTFKILPMLSTSISSGQGAQSSFACVVKMKDRMTEVDFGRNVVKAHAVKWFSNPTLDRNSRIEMLSKIDIFVGHFDASDVNGPIFSALGAAMQDAAAPALRDAAVKAVVTIVPVLTDKNLNSALMSHFARLQVDPEPAIRTNTTVCLGRLASRLNQATRNKVLTAAFLRTLKDPFPPARAAGANAILMTADMYSISDVATRVLPGVSPLLVDKESDVRSLAFKILAAFQVKLENNHSSMTSASQAAIANPGAAHGGGTGSSASKGSAAAGNSWGLSSLSSMTNSLRAATASAPANRAASGGISSEDYKPGGRAGAPAASKPAAIAPMAAASTPAVPAAFAASPLALSSNGGDGFGEFQSGASPAVDVDDDDGDGWGDMDLKSPNGKASGGGEEDDFLSMLGPPVGARRPAQQLASEMTRSASGMSMASTGTSGTGDGMWDAAPPGAAAGRPVVGAPVSRKGGLPTSNPMMGMAPPRKPVKKAADDDWGALLGGGTSTSRRKGGGLGATKR